MGYSRRHTKNSQVKHRRRHRRRSAQRGGDASDFVSKIVGRDVTTQINNVLGGNSNNNTIKPLMGGGRKRGGGHKTQRGGYWAQVINNAIVPLTLFALHKKMSKSRGSHTMKRGR